MATPKPSLSSKALSLNEVLASIETLSTAISELYAHFKAQDAKYSLSYFCRRAGIPSTGYLSDVIAGRRRLNKRYVCKLAEAFGLVRQQADFFYALHALDCAKSEEDRLKLTAAVERHRKVLAAMQTKLPSSGVEQLFFALEVFGAFGLFGGRPTTLQLKTYYKGRCALDKVDAATKLLVSMGMIEATSDGAWQPCANYVLFSESHMDVSFVDYVRMAIEHASKNVATWSPRRELSHFEAAVLSVDSKRWQEKLAAFKDDLLSIQTDLVSDNADMLVRLNVQAYPLSVVAGGE